MKLKKLLALLLALAMVLTSFSFAVAEEDYEFEADMYVEASEEQEAEAAPAEEAAEPVVEEVAPEEEAAEAAADDFVEQPDEQEAELPAYDDDPATLTLAADTGVEAAAGTIDERPFDPEEYISVRLWAENTIQEMKNRDITDWFETKPELFRCTCLCSARNECCYGKVESHKKAAVH